MRVVVGCYTSRIKEHLIVCPAKHEIIFNNTSGDVCRHAESAVGVGAKNSVIVYEPVGCWLVWTSITSVLNAPSAVCYNVVANCYAAHAVKRSVECVVSRTINPELSGETSLTSRIVDEVSFN